MGRVAGLTPEETRKRLLDAAARVFADCGYEGARVAQIAQEAGLSVGSIYSHYQSKAELLLAVVDSNSGGELADLLAAGVPMGVIDLIAAHAQRLGASGTVAPLLAELILASRRDPEVAQILTRQISGSEGVLADVVRFAQTAGEVREDADAAVIARFCLMLGLGSLLVGAMDLPSTDPDAWAAFVGRLTDGLRVRTTQQA